MWTEEEELQPAENEVLHMKKEVRLAEEESAGEWGPYQQKRGWTDWEWVRANLGEESMN